jgi:hypothetical protein
LDFALTFVFIISVGGLQLWIPRAAATVMQVDCNVGCAITTDQNGAFPSTGVSDGLLFVSTAAGLYPCAFRVQAGQNIYFVVSGPNPYKIALAYMVDPPDAEQAV